MNIFRQYRLLLGLVAAIVVAWTGTALPARADALDRALRLRAVKLMQKLKADGYKNVSILRFRVQKGQGQPTFTAGLLNSAMATRLENALILVNSERSPLGITRDAGTVAAHKDRKATYLTAEGRRKLFENEYPLAWDGRQIKVDAFLTGLVRVRPDMRQSTVVIQVFDRAHPEALREIDHFTVTNDLGVFSDLGAGYGVVKRDLRLGADAPSEPEAAPARPHKTPQHTAHRPEVPVIPVALKDDLEALDLVDFKVYYDDKPVEIVQRNGECRIPSPTNATHEIRFDLANKTGKPLAVVLLVNGVNTVNGSEQGKAPASYTKWVLKDQRTYSINGIWSADGHTVHRFKVASSTELAGMSDLNLDKIGQIELFVFPTVEARTMVAKAAPQDLSLKDRATATRNDIPLREVKRNIHRTVSAENRRPVIVPGAGEQQKLKLESLENLGDPVYLIIRY